MGGIEQSIEVAAAPQRVWEAVVDFEARPRWAPRVKKAEIVGGGALREGSRIRLQVGGDRLTPTVVEMSQPEHLALLVRFPGVRALHIYELRPSGDHTTVTLRTQYGGLLGGLVERLTGGSIRRDLAEELAAIKKAAEAGLAD